VVRFSLDQRGKLVQRRQFLTLVGGVAAWPLAARAQPTMPVIGFLNSGSPEPNPQIIAAFREGLKQSGFVEGQNVTIEYRWARGQFDRLPAMAQELVGHRVSVLVAFPVAATEAAKAATSTIPIVFQIGGDPVRLGIVASDHREQIILLAERYKLPTSYEAREFTADGGLMSYGPDFSAIFRQLGIYVARILKGEKVADLPVQQPTKFELVINLKAAKEIGLTVPPSLLARADQVIE
jgi:ABC-type uncharacterized transport system substrate-binding protein